MESPRWLSGSRVALCIVAAAAALRLYGIDWGLPEIYEEAVPLTKAWKMWGWGEANELDLNPHFFNYPTFVLYVQFIGQGLLYLGMRLAGAVGSVFDFQVLYILDKTPFVLLARLITAAFGTATVWVTYLTGRRAAGELAGLSAALFLAVSTFHMERCRMIEVDVPLLFFTMLSLLFIVRILEEPNRRNYLLAGLAVGLAVSSKYTGAFLILPLAAAHLSARHAAAGRRKRKSMRHAARGKRPPGKNRGKRNEAARSGAPSPSWRILAVSLVLAAVVFAATSPFVFLDAKTFLQHFALERQHMQLGHFGSGATRSYLYYGRALAGRVCGWPLALLALAGLVYPAGILRRRWAIVLAAFSIPYLFAIGSWAMKADRYLLPVLPALLILAGGTIAEGLRRLEGRRMSGGLLRGAVAAAVIIASVPLFVSFAGYAKLLRVDTRSLAKEWIEAYVPSGAFIVAEMYAPDFLAPPDLSLLDIKLREEVIRCIHDRPQYAVLPVPMFQVKPERSAPFYDMALYKDADVVITSSFVGSRYRREPDRFRRQMAFYDSLDADFELMQEFVPQSQPGPHLRVYKDPRFDTPFGGRRHIAGPAGLRLGGMTATGSEELFYYNIGVNYEAFGRYGEALGSYELGLGYPLFREASFLKLVLGKTRCLVKLKRVRDAVDFLEEAGPLAPNAEIGAKMGILRRDIMKRSARR